MSDNLKVAKECGAAVVVDADWYECASGEIVFYNEEQLEAYTSRILASQQAAHEAEIARLKEEMRALRTECAGYMVELIGANEQLSAANAACAMKDEALKFVLLTAIYVIGQDEELPQRIMDFLAANVDSLPDDKTGEQILDDAIACLAASSQQVSEWERKQIEPLMRRIAELEAQINK